VAKPKLKPIAAPGMKLVKMITTYAGPSGNIVAGQIGGLPLAEAKRLIAAGYATAVDEPKAAAETRETATVSAPETPENPAPDSGPDDTKE